MKTNDNTLDFFEKYLAKYVVEITDFNYDIKINGQDNEMFLNAISVCGSRGFYECGNDELKKATEIYDAVAFYVSCGLLSFNFDEKNYYINPKKLLSKVNAKENWNKNYEDGNNYEVVSIYKKGSKK